MAQESTPYGGIAQTVDDNDIFYGNGFFHINNIV
jgi:hypothetical protein